MTSIHATDALVLRPQPVHAAGGVGDGARSLLAPLAYEIGRFGVVSRADDAANLVDALDFIEKLRLEHQGRQLRDGHGPDNHLAPDELSPLVRQNLKAAFAQVRVSQAAMLNRFHIT